MPQRRRHPHTQPDSARTQAMKVRIMSPAADRVDFKVPPATRLTNFASKTIGLYNNMTGGADVAVDCFAEQLQRRYPSVKFQRQVPALRRRPARRPSRAQPGRPHRRRGSHTYRHRGRRHGGRDGALRGCRSRLSHDMVAMEKAGIPAVAIAACSRWAFIRTPGIFHTRPSRSISSQVAKRTSPLLHAVRTMN